MSVWTSSFFTAWFHCRCFVRNQSLLAVTGPVTRGLIGPQAAGLDRVRVLSLKPERWERLGYDLNQSYVFFSAKLCTEKERGKKADMVIMFRK